MSRFKVVDSWRYATLKHQAQGGKGPRARLRVCEGDLLRQATVGALDAYTACQAVRFYARHLLEKEMERRRVVDEHPFIDTPVDFGEPPPHLQAELTAPSEEEVQEKARRVGVMYVMVPEDDWRAMIEFNIVPLGIFRREQFKHKRKSKKKGRGGRELTDDEVLDLLADEAEAEYCQPSIRRLIISDEPGFCACIPVQVEISRSPIRPPRPRAPRRRRPKRQSGQLPLFETTSS